MAVYLGVGLTISPTDVLVRNRVFSSHDAEWPLA